MVGGDPIADVPTPRVGVTHRTNVQVDRLVGICRQFIGQLAIFDIRDETVDQNAVIDHLKRGLDQLLDRATSLFGVFGRLTQATKHIGRFDVELSRLGIENGFPPLFGIVASDTRPLLLFQRDGIGAEPVPQNRPGPTNLDLCTENVAHDIPPCLGRTKPWTLTTGLTCSRSGPLGDKRPGLCDNIKRAMTVNKVIITQMFYSVKFWLGSFAWRQRCWE